MKDSDVINPNPTKSSKMMKSIQRLQTMVGMEEGPRSKRPPMLHIILIISFGLIMKTIDSTTDIWTVGNLYVNNHTNWSLVLLVPILMNTVITAIAWAYLENPLKNGCKAWRSFPLVFLQLYPQYRAFRLLLIGFGKWGLSSMVDDSAYEKAKKQYDDTIANLEGLFESIPELFAISYFILYLFIAGFTVVEETRETLFDEISQSCLENSIPPYSKDLTLASVNHMPALRTEDQNKTISRCVNTYYDIVISEDLMAKITQEDFNNILNYTYKDITEEIIPNNILHALQNLWTDNTNTDSNSIPERELKFRAFQSYIFFYGTGWFLTFSFVISFFSASFVLTKASISGPGFSDETNNITAFSKALIFLLNMVFLWHKIIASAFILANMQNHEKKLPYVLLLLVLTLPHLIIGIFSLFIHVELKQGGIKVNKKVKEVFKILRGYPFLLMVPCLSPIVLHLSDVEEETKAKCEDFVNDKKDPDDNPFIVTIVCNLQSVVNALLHFGVLIPTVVYAGQDHKISNYMKHSVGFIYFYIIIVAAIILALIGLIALLQRRQTVM